jgi:hypothetical protein
MDTASLQATGTRLLTEHGEAISFTIESATFDPDTGAKTSSTSTVAGVGYPSQYRKSDIDGSVIRQGDIRLVTGKLDQRPQVGWLVEVDSVTYRVMDVVPIRASGADIIYLCQIRTA